MTVRTIPLADLVCVVRKPFELLSSSDGAPIGDRRTGEAIHVAEAVVPGLLAGRFNLEDRPSSVRIKMVGNAPGDLAAGSIVRLVAPKLTTWYMARARGADAKSAATISVDRVELANGQTPQTRGGLPAHTAGIGAMFLGQVGEFVDVMFDASGVFSVEGVAEVRCSTTVPADLLAQPVNLIGLRAYFTQPDREDVGQRSKAELLLACSGIERAGAASSNGRARKSEPTVDAAAEAS